MMPRKITLITNGKTSKEVTASAWKNSKVSFEAQGFREANEAEIAMFNGVELPKKKEPKKATTEGKKQNEKG